MNSESLVAGIILGGIITLVVVAYLLNKYLPGPK